ncbi:hypothetical protein G4B88_022497 [Cannabis sativa]|uniref:Uncharacterized protein n=1 Tax=Cannabis sativa TaxID=3483 RepID=A0A7J6HVR4_CANSA|nr:hypothetical protein G4B88_022497 [Cannabis sativa]
MALTCQFSPHILLAKKSTGLVIKPFGNVLRLKQRHIPVKKITAPSLKIRSSYKEKIQKAEISTGDVEILDIIQERWLNFVRGTELNPTDHKGVAFQGDINCNGFNNSLR